MSKFSQFALASISGIEHTEFYSQKEHFLIYIGFLFIFIIKTRALNVRHKSRSH